MGKFGGEMLGEFTLFKHLAEKSLAEKSLADEYRSAKGLLVISTNLDSFSLVNCR